MKRSSSCRSLAFVLCCALPALACQSPPERGMMEARWTAKDGHSEMVPFSFEELGETHGGLFTTLGKGGEHYSGPYVLVRAATDGKLVTEVYDGMTSPEWTAWQDGPDGTWQEVGVSFGAFSDFYTGKAVASLDGNRGDRMRCQLQLERPSEGLAGGGTGQCQTTAGDRIELAFSGLEEGP